MPLFEVTTNELVPFRRVQAGPELYENEIEALMWDNLEAFTGEPLFRLARQPQIRTGGRPDIVALDADGNVHVVEVKRDVHRGQLAQCLEYAGWARNANLDELAGIYHAGPDAFFADWTEFTDTTAPRLVSRTPRLVLVARDIDGRTADALGFLTDSNLAILVLRVVVYQDQHGRRFIDVEGDHEPEFVTVVDADPADPSPVHLKLNGRRVQMSDLLDAGLVTAGEVLEWDRPRTGDNFTVVVTPAGALELPDGRTFATPSRAAMEAAGVGSYDGWHAWRNSDGLLLHKLRVRLVEAMQTADDPDAGQEGAPDAISANRSG